MVIHFDLVIIVCHKNKYICRFANCLSWIFFGFKVRRKRTCKAWFLLGHTWKATHWSCYKRRYLYSFDKLLGLQTFLLLKSANVFTFFHVMAELSVVKLFNAVSNWLMNWILSFNVSVSAMSYIFWNQAYFCWLFIG